jgi:hypothetical protein
MVYEQLRVHFYPLDKQTFLSSIKCNVLSLQNMTSKCWWHCRTHLPIRHHAGQKRKLFNTFCMRVVNKLTHKATDYIHPPRKGQQWFWHSVSSEPDEAALPTQSTVCLIFLSSGFWHSVVWWMFRGDTLPLCTCNTTCCYNPEHHNMNLHWRQSLISYNCYLKWTYTFSEVCME